MTTSGEPNGQRVQSVTAHEVTLAQLAHVRRLVTDVAEQTGVDPERAARFVVAVNEIMINAIQHGGGCRSVTVTAEPGRVAAEVRDYGLSPLTIPSSTELPGPDAVHGRGIWLVRRLCDDLEFVTAPDGARIRIAIGTGPHI